MNEKHTHDFKRISPGNELMRCAVCNLYAAQPLAWDLDFHRSPWSLMNSHKPGYSNVVAWGDDQPQSRKFICEVGPSDTRLGDAQLISFAPTLLKQRDLLLERLVALLGHFDATSIWLGECNPEAANNDVEAARAAIKELAKEAK